MTDTPHLIARIKALLSTFEKQHIPHGFEGVRNDAQQLDMDHDLPKSGRRLPLSMTKDLEGWQSIDGNETR